VLDMEKVEIEILCGMGGRQAKSFPFIPRGMTPGHPIPPRLSKSFVSPNRREGKVEISCSTFGTDEFCVVREEQVETIRANPLLHFLQ